MRPHRTVPLAVPVAVIAVVAGLLATSAGAAPRRPVPRQPAAQPDPFVLASLAPETGTLGRILESLREPVRLAVDEINAAGGVEGGPVTLVTADEGTDAATTRASTTRLLDTHDPDAIIGPAQSSSALSILPLVKGDALVCSGSNTSARLTTAGPKRSGGLYFRTAPPDRLQGTALAQLVLDDGRRDVVVLAADDAAARPVADALDAALTDGRADVTRLEVAADPADAASAAARVARLAPDAVVVVADTEQAAGVVAALLAAGVTPAATPIYGSDGLYDPDFPELVDVSVPGVVAGIKGTVPAADPAGSDTPFRTVFAATGIDPVFSAAYYDCTILTALAALQAGSTDPTAMARAFTANLRGDNDCTTFAECAALLERGESIHYRGASSTFEAFGEHEPGEGVYEVWGYAPTAQPIVGGPETRLEVRDRAEG